MKLSQSKTLWAGFLAAALVTVLNLSSAAQAAVLHDNGSGGGDSTLCHSNTATCGSIGWHIYDDFPLAQNSVVTGFTYNSLFSDPSHYVSTNWSIWAADPKFNFAGGPLFSGTDIGVLSAAGDGTTTITVVGLSIALASGTYWLGTQDNVDDGSITTYGLSTTGCCTSAEQSDNAGNFFNPILDEAAFTIIGDTAAVPVPPTLVLFGAALVGFGLGRRAKTA